MEIVIALLLFIFFYFGYKIFVKAAKAVTKKDIEQDIFSGELKKEGTKFSVKFKDWFVWNVTVNNEKGTAGGNIKINFPIQYAAILCVIITIIMISFPVTAWLMPLIFGSFAVYYFRKWFLSLRTIRQVANTAPVNNFNYKTKLSRSAQNNIIAGVCRGLSSYYNIPVLPIRLLFLASSFFGVGVVFYILLSIVLPLK
jgi:phage shock protein PspC (stress-responsive transcriptional regulator)